MALQQTGTRRPLDCAGGRVADPDGTMTGSTREGTLAAGVAGAGLPARQARRRRKAAWVASGLLGSLLLLATPCSAKGDDPETVLGVAQQQMDAVAAEVGSIEHVAATKGATTRTPEKRIADASLLIGVKDYDRAADVLNQVTEQFPDHPTAYPDALRLLGETYFLSKQYLSARQVFQSVVDRSDDRRFGAFRDHAVVRLVDVALRTGDIEPLRALFKSLDAKLGAGDSSAALAYARGRGQYALGDLKAAAASLGSVSADSEYAHQARYLLGVLDVRDATPPAPAAGAAGSTEAAPVVQTFDKRRYAKAIDAFKAVTLLRPDTVEHRRVIDLAWIAMARLLYESDQWTQAVEAYNHIDRSSPEFPVMLYELAWVYVRLGDVVRARRALEVLAVAAPNDPEIADASLLRADLMLRAGQFDKSLKVYENVRGTYDTMRDRVEGFLHATTDPKAFFDALSQEQAELFESSAGLPALALRWAKDGEDGPAAFAVVDEIAICRTLIKQSNEMIDRLNAVLSSPNRVRALPELKVATEKGLGLTNTVALARLRLGGGLDGVRDDADLPAHLRELRQRRHQLEQRLGLVPVTAGDFAAREVEAKRQWNQASQGLQRLDLELDTLQATINGLRRMIQDGPQAGVVRDPAQLQSVLQALGEEAKNVKVYRDQMADLRKLTEAGKVQVGFGDRRFIEDAETRKAFRELLSQEVQASAAGEGGPELANYAKRVDPVLRKGDDIDARIERALSDLDRLIANRAGELRTTVQQETANIVQYSLALEQLDQEARLVVGGVAARNFANVRDRLKNIVLRADVGVTEEAWEVREEQLTRVRRLRIEKARGEKLLQDELAEVLDDSGDPEDQP
jgi:tetratricopeptide (TPR) repeat protein